MQYILETYCLEHHVVSFPTFKIRRGFTLGRGGAIALPQPEPSPQMLVTAAVKTAYLEVGVVHLPMF